MPELIFVRPDRAIRFSNLLKKIFQKTILNLKFKFPVKNTLLLLAGNLNFWRFGGLKNTQHFLKKSHLQYVTILQIGNHKAKSLTCQMTQMGNICCEKRQLGDICIIWLVHRPVMLLHFSTNFRIIHLTSVYNTADCLSFFLKQTL